HICFGFYIIRGSRSFLSAVPAFIFLLMLKDSYLSDFQQNCCDKVELIWDYHISTTPKKTPEGIFPGVM
ncbi:MAG: hypothetical protein ACK5WO_08545, partial [Cyclobacteriaceae bacterium]